MKRTGRATILLGRGWLLATLAVGCGGDLAPEPATYRGVLPDNDTRLRGEVVITLDDRGRVLGTLRDGGRVDEIRGDLANTQFRGDVAGVRLDGTLYRANRDTLSADWDLEDGTVEDEVRFTLERL